MIPEAITLPGLTDDEQRTLSLLLDQLDVKARRNRLRAAYYDMRHAPSLIGSAIPTRQYCGGITEPINDGA